MRTAIFFLLPALALGATFTPDLSHPRVHAARQVHTKISPISPLDMQDSSASGDISDDLGGVEDTRPNTWGTTDSFSVPIVFDPPEGYTVRIRRIEGDLSGMPKHLPDPVTRLLAAIVPNAFAGLLEGFSTNQPAVPGCDFCSTSTPQYRQIFVADGQTFHAAFTYDFKNGLMLAPDNILNAIGASFLNTLGCDVHAELTYTFWYDFIPSNMVAKLDGVYQK